MTISHITEINGDRAWIRYEVAMRPWTVNAERAGNRWKRAENTKKWRELFASVTGLPKLIGARVEVALELRGRLQDTAACMPAVKAAIDGMVDANVFPDDTGEYVKAIIFNAPSRSKEDKIIIIVEGRINE